MREACAKWHEDQAEEYQKACDAAWAECVPEHGLKVIGVHKNSAAAIRALPLPSETKETV